MCVPKQWDNLPLNQRDFQEHKSVIWLTRKSLAYRDTYVFKTRSAYFGPEKNFKFP